MVESAVYILVFLLAPAGVMWLCSRVKVLGRIGPVLLLYIIGIILGNIWKPDSLASVQDVLSNAVVPLAIPLMLMSCTYRKTRTGTQLAALMTGLAAVVAAVIAGFLIFGGGIADGEKVGGMLTGVYTGGTINLAALKTMLDVPEETFILLNSYDMVISFLYLTFLLSVGIKAFRKFLPYQGALSECPDEKSVEKGKASPKDIIILIGVTLMIVGVSAGLGLLAGDAWFMVVLILSLTTLGIAASFIPGFKAKGKGYDIGMYLIYIFSIVVASMADLSKFDVAGGLGMLGYLTFVIFVSLAIQVLLARLFRIDADTVVVTSVTLICSPPFVPMMSAAMKNRNVLAVGLTIGVIGYAVGNYLGFLLYRLLLLV